MIVLDDFLPEPDAIREQGLAAPYVDWPGPDGEVYKRICIADIPGFQEGIEREMGQVVMLGMAYRLNFNREMPNAAIHSDIGWGTHAAVLYLCEGQGGTAFWRHKATGADRIEPQDFTLWERVRGDWDNADAWELIDVCPLRFNRCVIYESKRFHSRWPFEAFGTNRQTGRLIGVAFFTPMNP